MIHRFLFVCFDGRKGNSFLLNSYVLLTFFYQKIECPCFCTEIKIDKR